MKKHHKGTALILVTALLGTAAMLLRRLLYLTAVDEKGLLVPRSPLWLLLLALTAAAALTVGLAVWRREPEERPVSGGLSGFLSAMGHVAAATGIVMTVLTGVPQTIGYLADVWRLLGYVAPVCLLAAGVAVMLGRKPFFLLYTAVSLFFMVHIVCHYQSWSAHPQMQDYVFALLAAMALAFCGYYTAAGAAGCGNGRMKLAMELAALYLCPAELAGSAYPLLYLGGFLWVLTQRLPAGEKD